MNAGDALRHDLGLFGGGQVANLVSRHADAAGKLRVLMIAFTAVFIITVALERHSKDRTTGIGWIDAIVGGALRALRGLVPARVVMGLLALGCLYFVFLTGDLGARAVWRGRVRAAQAFGPGGPAVPQVAQP